jgi:predicted GH43/DUF377 family glycosyl hydrolase
MKCITLILMLSFLGLSPLTSVRVQKQRITPYVSDGSLAGYKLVWHDEFDGKTVNTNDWNYRTGERFWSTQRPENVSVADGKLRLALKKEKFANTDYTAGGLISKREFKFGYYEARLKMPHGKGWHTSFWMMRNGDDREQELDVCEQDSINPNDYSTNVHGYKPAPKAQGARHIATPDLSADFHVWACEFTPTTVRYYFDGKVVDTRGVTNVPLGDASIWLTSIAAPLGKTDKVDDSALPSFAEFDYVRFFEKSAQTQNHSSAQMMFADDSRGRPFSKDPHVIFFKGRYLLYYSLPSFGDGRASDGWAIGIAESRDLTNWKKVGEILPQADYEAKGMCAPGALVRDGKVHLFYQTYGNGPKDAICHAISEDGISFTRDATNPVFHPAGNWTSGRAIDAEVVIDGPTAFLYFATRDPASKIQKLGVATASSKSDFSREAWKQASEDSILFPQLPWEGECIEAPSVIKRGNEFVMFYAGAYNNWPQQVGVAISRDGLHWHRASEQPFLTNGKPGEWNASESGHPHIFRDRSGRTWLFFQGNQTQGKDWYLSKVEVFWRNGRPSLKP